MDRLPIARRATRTVRRGTSGVVGPTYIDLLGPPDVSPSANNANVFFKGVSRELSHEITTKKRCSVTLGVVEAAPLGA